MTVPEQTGMFPESKKYLRETNTLAYITESLF